MDTSYVTVGTAMYMITDSLACRALKKGPAGAGRRCHSCPPAIHAAFERSTSEPAAKE